MNLNKFLINPENDDTLQPVNSQFSGIFKKSSLHKSTPRAESSSNEFLAPKRVYSNSHSFPHKSFEESSENIFGNLDNNEKNVLMKVSRNFNNGSMTFQRDSANNLSNVIFYDLSQLSLINHHCTLSPELLGLNQDKNLFPKIKKKVGRPKNEEKRAEERKSLQFKPQDLIHRTKSGRPVKTNQDAETSIFSSNQFIFESKMTSDDEMFKSHIQFTKTQPKSQELVSLTEAPRKQRKISSQFRCSFCKKIYLGKNKMNHHYKNFPNHRLPQNENESKLFSHLMSMVREKKSNEEMAAEFFREVSTFVQLCEKLTPKLITNLDSENTHQQVIDKNAASLLRINPGNYKINMNVFDKSFKFDSPSQEIDESRESLTDSTTATESEKLSPTSSKPLIIIDDVPSLDGNECSSLLIKANELTNLTNISLETEDF